eukprot:363625-Chlamydomonas_euryale.AAC.15
MSSLFVTNAFVLTARYGSKTRPHSLPQLMRGTLLPTYGRTRRTFVGQHTVCCFACAAFQAACCCKDGSCHAWHALGVNAGAFTSNLKPLLPIVPLDADPTARWLAGCCAFWPASTLWLCRRSRGGRRPPRRLRQRPRCCPVLPYPCLRAVRPRPCWHAAARCGSEHQCATAAARCEVPGCFGADPCWCGGCLARVRGVHVVCACWCGHSGGSSVCPG